MVHAACHICADIKQGCRVEDFCLINSEKVQKIFSWASKREVLVHLFKVKGKIMPPKPMCRAVLMIYIL